MIEPGDPRETLDKAREHFRDKDYPTAFELYKHFFDHALDGDPYSLYGVRLSYCLDEWARLGKKYRPAQERLEERKIESLKIFEETGKANLFHEYMAFCRCLNTPDKPIEQFVKYHEENKDLAEKSAHYIWNQLVEAQYWELCAAYMPDPNLRYDHSMMRFDQSMKLHRSDPVFGGENFATQVKDWIVNDVSNILNVLKHDDQIIAFEEMKNRAYADLKEKGYPELENRIENNIAR